MSAEAMCWAYDQTVGDPAAKFVLIMLADWCEGTEFSTAMDFIEPMAARCELPHDKMLRALDILFARGYLRREAVWSDGGWREGVVLGLNPPKAAIA